MLLMSGSSVNNSCDSLDKYNPLTLHIAKNSDYSGIIEFLVINRIFSDESAVPDTELYCALNNDTQSVKKALRWLKKKKLCCHANERLYANGKNHIRFYLSEKGQKIGNGLLDCLQSEEYLSQISVKTPESDLKENGNGDTSAPEIIGLKSGQGQKDKKPAECSGFESAETADAESLTGPGDIIWDDAQRYVINYPLDKRLVVDAGPGTGKTEVALSRVAHLVNDCRINAGSIWIISFSNTAVNELKNRIVNNI